MPVAWAILLAASRERRLRFLGCSQPIFPPSRSLSTNLVTVPVFGVRNQPPSSTSSKPLTAA